MRKLLQPFTIVFPMKANVVLKESSKLSSVVNNPWTKKSDALESEIDNSRRNEYSDFSFSQQPVFNYTTGFPSGIQPKLRINEPGDKYEQEADAMAEKIMRMDIPDVQTKSLSISVIQRKCAHCEEEEKKKLQRKETNIQTATTSHSLESYVNGLNIGGQPLSMELRNFYEPRLGFDFSKVRIHDNTSAAQSAQSINALAYTHGNNIVFNSGQYLPKSSAGKKLLGHELMHVVQQRGTVQRQTVNMPSQNITAGMPNATDLQQLTGQLNNPGFSASFSQTHINLNSPLPSTILPFTSTGWDGNEIAAKLGQHDRLPVTDSDAFRCVQTVALMSHIIQGPAAVFSYLSSIKMQSLFGNNSITQRMRIAWQVMEHVKTRIRHQQATYGDMAQMIEAIHAMFYKDDLGTPRDQINDQVNPMLDLSSNMQRMDLWCSSPSDLLRHATTLQNGEQFLLNTWNVSFNANFDLAEGGDTDISQANSARINVINEETGRGRNVRIRRIDATRRPDSSRIDRNRDTMSGHQMLIYKDVANGHIMMYEPELTATGNHLFDITQDASPLTNLFAEQPAFELYQYVQLLGKLTPATALSSGF